MSSHLQTGTVRLQGEPSQSLFLVTVHHFVYKIAHSGLWLMFPPFCSNQMSVFYILTSSSVLTYALTMSKQHLQFVKEGKLLWSSKLIIRVSTLCQRYVKETLSSLASRYLAKLNTLPDTSWLLCLMETPLTDILAEDSCFDNPTPKVGKSLYPIYPVIPFKACE